MTPLPISSGLDSELTLLPVLAFLGCFFGGGIFFLASTGGGLGLRGIGALFKPGLFDRDSLFSLRDKVVALRKVVSGDEACVEFMPRRGAIPGLPLAEGSGSRGRLAYSDLVLDLGLAIGGGLGFLGNDIFTCGSPCLLGNARRAVASCCEELELPAPV